MNHTELKGYCGEIFAELLLRIKGYTILERRYKTVCGEIDIIAKKNDYIVFVEVKSRNDFEKCYIALRTKQLQRIRNSSQIFINRNKKFVNCFSRFDVILIANWKFPKHIENI